MKPEELTDDLKGAKVRARLDATWDDARVTVRGWTANRQTVFATVDSPYGKKFPQGTSVEIPVQDIRIPEE